MRLLRRPAAGVTSRSLEYALDCGLPRERAHFINHLLQHCCTRPTSVGEVINLRAASEGGEIKLYHDEFSAARSENAHTRATVYGDARYPQVCKKLGEVAEIVYAMTIPVICIRQ